MDNFNNVFLIFINFSKAFSEKKKFVFGDSFIAAGYITYLGPHDQDIRLKTCEMWGRKVSFKQINTCNIKIDIFCIDLY